MENAYYSTRDYTMHQKHNSYPPEDAKRIDCDEFAGYTPSSRRQISSVVISEEYLTRSMPEHSVRFVEVPVIEEVVKTVPVKSIVEVEKVVPKYEIEYVDKLIEVPQIEYRDHHIEKKEIREVPREVLSPIKQIKVVPKEVIKQVPKIEYVEVERTVEVPGEIIRVPKPGCEQEIHLELEETPVAVSQKIEPIMYDAETPEEVETYELEPKVVPVDIHVLTPVASKITAIAAKEKHEHVNLPPAQYNTILKQLNAHLENLGTPELPYIEEDGVIPFLSIDELPGYVVLKDMTETEKAKLFELNTSQTSEMPKLQSFNTPFEAKEQNTPKMQETNRSYPSQKSNYMHYDQTSIERPTIYNVQPTQDQITPHYNEFQIQQEYKKNTERSLKDSVCSTNRNLPQNEKEEEPSITVPQYKPKYTTQISENKEISSPINQNYLTEDHPKHIIQDSNKEYVHQSIPYTNTKPVYIQPEEKDIYNRDQSHLEKVTYTAENSNREEPIYKSDQKSMEKVIYNPDHPTFEKSPYSLGYPNNLHQSPQTKTIYKTSGSSKPCIYTSDAVYISPNSDLYGNRKSGPGGSYTHPVIHSSVVEPIDSVYTPHIRASIRPDRAYVGAEEHPVYPADVHHYNEEFSPPHPHHMEHPSHAYVTYDQYEMSPQYSYPYYMRQIPQPVYAHPYHHQSAVYYHPPMHPIPGPHIMPPKASKYTKPKSRKPVSKHDVCCSNRTRKVCRC